MAKKNKKIKEFDVKAFDAMVFDGIETNVIAENTTANNIQPMGEIMVELEDVLEKMTDPNGHDLQWFEVLNLVRGYLEVHAPHAQETYEEDGSHPVFYYGPKQEK